MNIELQIENAFKELKNEYDITRIDIDNAHALIIMAQDNGEGMEYLIELNNISNGWDEPCAQYNATAKFGDYTDFKESITEYLKTNSL